MVSNIKAAPVEITPGRVAAVIDWLDRNHPDARQQSLAREDVVLLKRGDVLIMHEATMGEGDDGIERIYAPGTRAVFWMREQLGPPFGVAATLIIGPEDNDEAIVNCFYECDPSGFPFRRAEEARHGV